MALSVEKIKQIMDVVYLDANRRRIKSDFQKYMIYNGQLRDEIEKAIAKEFILPETINELCKRIIPINIVQKIISKLAKVYSTPPMRAPLEPLESDIEALEFHEAVLNPNKHMKDANRLFKLHKNDAIEPYASTKGEPCMRVNPSYSYTLYSDDPIEPNRHTAFVKHMKWDDQSRENDRHLIWTDTDQVEVDGSGRVISADANPYKVMPFVVIKESENFLTPIPDDDLVNIQFVICLLLTDLAFAAKYQSWSIFYTIGVDSKNMSFNPNSVVSLIQKDPDGVKPEIGTIKPELDSDEMLRLVEALVGLLLTTKSLSIGNVSTKLDTANTASGVAKLFDSAESTEDRTDQIEYFRCGEQEFWMMYAHEILPVWIANGMIRPEFYVPFSEDFILSIEFPEQKPIVSDKEKIETSEVAIKAGLSSRKREIKRLNPDLDDAEIDKLILEIEQEDDARMEKAMNSMNKGPNGQDNQNQLPEPNKPNS